MRNSHYRIAVLTYVSLAAGCVFVGTLLTYLLLIGSQYFGIDLMDNLWLFAIPSLLSLLLNVLFVELYRKFGRK
jgi:hypothetical protein